MPIDFPGSPSTGDHYSYDERTWRWEAPVAYPTDGKTYTWDEDTTSWVEFAPTIEE